MSDECRIEAFGSGGYMVLDSNGRSLGTFRNRGDAYWHIDSLKPKRKRQAGSFDGRRRWNFTKEDL
jgi:hypothetical protein